MAIHLARPLVRSCLLYTSDAADDLVAELNGSISAEHGLGRLRREEVKRYKSAVELDLMQKVKIALDPDNIMNPGKVL